MQLGVSQETRVQLNTALLNWYSQNARDLPWRHTTDPYAIWVSEVMLQQTQVKTVIPYYNHFLQLFPTVGALATAPPADLARAWAGLGYYSRVQRLKQAAQCVVENYHGAIPNEWDEFRKLPGVGDYTAGAVLSIAFQKRFPAVDGNVKRVLARLFRVEEPIEKAKVHTALRSGAMALLPDTDVGIFNQALMELGSLVCVPNRPQCPGCPIACWCEAHKVGMEQMLPVRNPRKAPTRLVRVAGAVHLGDALLFTRRTTGPLRGYFEFPTYDLQPGDTLSDGVAHLVASLKLQGFTLVVGEKLGQVEYAFSHLLWEVHVYHLVLTDVATVAENPASYDLRVMKNRPRLEDVSSGGDGTPVWLPPDEVKQSGLPVALRKILDTAC